jgi:hypothetical protein
LKKEDFSNLFKDFDTLLRIDDISDLELNDFNSWEFNLDEYQKALDFEFEGKTIDGFHMLTSIGLQRGGHEALRDRRERGVR